MPTKTRVTIGDALDLFRRLRDATWYQSQTNETYYPAAWTYGDGAGEASTSDYYDRRKTVAAQRALAELCEAWDITVPDAFDTEDWQRMGTRDIARTIAGEVNAAIERDEAEYERGAAGEPTD